MISDTINEFYPGCMKRCVLYFFLFFFFNCSFCILRSNFFPWKLEIICDGQRTDLLALQAA